MHSKLIRSAIALAMAAGTVPAAAAVTLSWTGPINFDNYSTTINATHANSITFFGTDTSYGSGITGPMAHSHGQLLNYTIGGTVDGISATFLTQALGSNEQMSLVSLGTIHFTPGSVTSIDFGCDNCSNYTFHQFSGVTYTLGTVPEPATWGLLIVGFGMIGFAARRRSPAIAA